MGQDAVDVQKYLKAFCREAIGKGMLTSGQLKECLGELKASKARGESETLQSLFIKKEYLTLEQCTFATPIGQGRLFPRHTNSL